MIARLDVRLSGTAGHPYTGSWLVFKRTTAPALAEPPILLYPKGLGLYLLASNPCFVARDGWPGVVEDVFRTFGPNLAAIRVDV